MSSKFDATKWFGRGILFLLFFAPMLITQFSSDRSLIEQAVKEKEFGYCQQISRQYFFSTCQDKIVRQKKEMCSKLKVSYDCQEKWVSPIRNIPVTGAPLWTTLLEVLGIIILVLWIMGLTPYRWIQKLPHILKEISTSQNFTVIRIPLGFVLYTFFYFISSWLLNYL